MFITSSGTSTSQADDWETSSRTPQNLQGTPDNYLVPRSICSEKASVSTLMVGTQQVE
jgi:hypothetical protein